MRNEKMFVWNATWKRVNDQTNKSNKKKMVNELKNPTKFNGLTWLHFVIFYHHPTLGYLRFYLTLPIILFVKSFYIVCVQFFFLFSSPNKIMFDIMFYFAIHSVSHSHIVYCLIWLPILFTSKTYFSFKLWLCIVIVIVEIKSIVKGMRFEIE